MGDSVVGMTEVASEKAAVVVLEETSVVIEDFAVVRGELNSVEAVCNQPFMV